MSSLQELFHGANNGECLEDNNHANNETNHPERRRDEEEKVNDGTKVDILDLPLFQLLQEKNKRLC